MKLLEVFIVVILYIMRIFTNLTRIYWEFYSIFIIVLFICTFSGKYSSYNLDIYTDKLI